MSATEYDDYLRDLADYKAVLEKYAAVVGQSVKDSILITKLQSEIVRKEGVITSQIEKNKICYEMRDNLTAQVKGLEFIRDTQKETIAKLARPPKRFSLSIGAGYSAILRQGIVYGGPGLFAGIGWTIFRF